MSKVDFFAAINFYGTVTVEARISSTGEDELLGIQSINSGERLPLKIIRNTLEAGVRTVLFSIFSPESSYPGDAFVIFEFAKSESQQYSLAKIAETAFGKGPPSLEHMFRRHIEKHLAEHGSFKLLDIGGRARSGVLRSADYPLCDVTVLDIMQDHGVDVIADAHEMSNHLPHGHFDGAMAVSVFEHLLMPWKAAIEINHILKLGGMVLVHTHQTIGLHDMPWDFWRFSDECWKGIFNSYTGFEIVKAQLADFMHIIPRIYSGYQGAERSGGFRDSTVICRKIGNASVRWNVPLGEILTTKYPTE
jgi:hypothetical protein